MTPFFSLLLHRHFLHAMRKHNINHQRRRVTHATGATRRSISSSSCMPSGCVARTPSCTRASRRASAQDVFAQRYRAHLSSASLHLSYAGHRSLSVQVMMVPRSRGHSEIVHHRGSYRRLRAARRARHHSLSHQAFRRTADILRRCSVDCVAVPALWMGLYLTPLPSGTLLTTARCALTITTGSRYLPAAYRAFFHDKARYAARLRMYISCASGASASEHQAAAARASKMRQALA